MVRREYDDFLYGTKTSRSAHHVHGATQCSRDVTAAVDSNATAEQQHHQIVKMAECWCHVRREFSSYDAATKTNRGGNHTASAAQCSDAAPTTSTKAAAPLAWPKRQQNGPKIHQRRTTAARDGGSQSTREHETDEAHDKTNENDVCRPTMSPHMRSVGSADMIGAQPRSTERHHAVRRADRLVADKHARGQPSHEHETNETDEDAFNRTTIPSRTSSSDSADEHYGRPWYADTQGLIRWPSAMAADEHMQGRTAAARGRAPRPTVHSAEWITEKLRSWRSTRASGRGRGDAGARGGGRGGAGGGGGGGDEPWKPHNWNNLPPPPDTDCASKSCCAGC